MPPTPELYSAVSGDTGSMPVPELYVGSTNTMSMDGVNTGAVVAGGMMAGVMILIYFAIIVLMIVSFWKIFTKAGEKGWKSLIPFYNTWVLLEISGKPGWWLFLFFIPFVNIVIMIMMYNNLSKVFGKGIGYTLGFIFFAPIFFPILAFGSATYTKPVENGGEMPSQNPTPPQEPMSQTPPQNTQNTTM